MGSFPCRPRRDFRRVGAGFEFSGLSDISKLIDKARISGAVLETLEIRDVITVVDRACEWREIAFNPPQGMKQDWTAVRQLSSGIADFTEFLRAFRKAQRLQDVMAVSEQFRPSPLVPVFENGFQEYRRGQSITAV